MAHTLRSHTATITVSGGVGSVDSSDFTSPNVLIDAGGYIEQVMVIAPDRNTTFDFVIKTPNGNPAYRNRGNTEELIENTHTPIRGIYDFEISAGTKDGAYEIEIMVKEEW